jgi:hypothetical protein
MDGGVYGRGGWRNEANGGLGRVRVGPGRGLEACPTSGSQCPRFLDGRVDFYGTPYLTGAPV